MEDDHYEERDTIRDTLNGRGLDWEMFKRLADIVSEVEVISVDDLSSRVGRSRRNIRGYIPLLEEYECIYVSRYRKAKWLVCASTEEAMLCKRRKISLVVYRTCGPILEQLREDLRRYFARRQFQHWQLPVESMEAIKERYLWLLQPYTHPDVPVKEYLDNGRKKSLHLTHRYIRTMQDLVMAELGIHRDYFREVYLEVIPPDDWLTEEPSRPEQEEENMAKAENAQDAGKAPTSTRVVKKGPGKLTKHKESKALSQADKKTAGELLDEIADEATSKKERAPRPRKSEYAHTELPPQPPQTDVGELDPLKLNTKKVVKNGPDEGHKLVTCMVKGCKNTRIVKNQDVFQVKRCEGCQNNYRRVKRNEAAVRRRAAVTAKKGKKGKK